MLKFAGIASLLIFIPSSQVLHSDPAPNDTLGTQLPSAYSDGEELIYNVRYGFIDLGQVKIVSGERTREDSSTIFRSDAQIQSYQGVPFVDLHAVYHSTFDSTGFSHYFLGKSRENEDWSFSEYFFQYDHDRVVMKVGSEGETIERQDTVLLESPYHDGLSLFYYAREHLFSGSPMSIPTLVKEEKGSTFIDFKGERDVIESDFIDYPIDVVAFEGMAGFVGLFGLTGDFEGWFSNDEARVPIKANMKVIIGSVTLELIGWTRDGWEPPRAEDD